MTTQWRLFMAALGIVFRGAESPREANRFVPLAGILAGLGVALLYWLAAQAWPTSIAVAIAMAASASIAVAARPIGSVSLPGLFYVLIKYNALMALSSAAPPFALPEYLPLGLIMIAGEALSRALAITERITGIDLAIALLIGAAPGALLGIPGLIGIAAALIARLGLSACARTSDGATTRQAIARPLTEVCFYLTALAAWKYV